MTETTARRWQVKAFAEGIAAIVFQGEEAACRQVALSLVGKPLTAPGASGSQVQIGTVLRAEVSPA